LLNTLPVLTPSLPLQNNVPCSSTIPVALQLEHAPGFLDIVVVELGDMIVENLHFPLLASSQARPRHLGCKHMCRKQYLHHSNSSLRVMTTSSTLQAVQPSQPALLGLALRTHQQQIRQPGVVDFSFSVPFSITSHFIGENSTSLTIPYTDVKGI